MNILFLTQGTSINIFHELLPYLRQDLKLEKIGFYTSNSFQFDRFVAQHQEYNDQAYIFMKEWEILRDYPRINLDFAFLRKYEELIGDPNLWPAVIADRRLMLGKNCHQTQDYRTRYTHQQLLKMTQLTIKRLEDLFERVQPNLVLSFNLATFGEYLAFLLAKQKNIPFRQLKTAKIENYVMLLDDPIEIQTEIKKAMLMMDCDSESYKKAQAVLPKMQNKRPQYEGFYSSASPAWQVFKSHWRWQTAGQAIAFEIVYQLHYKFDHQLNGGIVPYYYNAISRPWRALRQYHVLKKRFLNPGQLDKVEYVFFPLHTEPETALSIHGRFYQNQIEVARNIAQSLPLTWKLVIKEHPCAFGGRKMSYYHKLLNIPNVVFVDPYASTFEIIKKAKAVIVISSSVGFEAVLLKKPVITLGQCTFNALPESMVKHVSSWEELPYELKRLVNDYHYDEGMLTQYLAAVIKKSYPINLYSDLLRKSGRHHVSLTEKQKQSAAAGFAKFIAQSLRS